MAARRLGSFVALWSAGFAAVHVAWALGWRGGVPDSAAPIAERPWFLAYDLAAAGAMLGAAVVAALLARGGLTRTARRRLTALTLVGGVLALLRGAPALAVDVVAWPGLTTGVLADVWFVVAGAAGVALWVLAGRDSDRPAQPASFSLKKASTRSTASC